MNKSVASLDMRKKTLRNFFSLNFSLSLSLSALSRWCLAEEKKTFVFTDTNYSDPVGPLPSRPMTSAGKRDDDFGDEELGDDLLPE